MLLSCHHSVLSLSEYEKIQTFTIWSVLALKWFPFWRLCKLHNKIHQHFEQPQQQLSENRRLIDAAQEATSYPMLPTCQILGGGAELSKDKSQPQQLPLAPLSLNWELLSAAWSWGWFWSCSLLCTTICTTAALILCIAVWLGGKTSA